MPTSSNAFKSGTRTIKWMAAVLMVALGGLMFAGCEASVSTGGDSIDTGSVEKMITNQYPGQTGGLKLTEINCDGGDAKVGATFNCTATNNVDSKLDIQGKITKVNDDNVDFNWNTTKTLAKGEQFATAATSELQKHGSAVTSIKCPAEIEVAKGQRVECSATMDNGTTQSVVITQTDNDGGFHAVLSGPAS